MHIDFIDRFKQIEAPPAPHSLVIFVNPATPDGKGYGIEPLLKQWHQNGCSVLIDESFLDFADIPSATRYLADYPNLYILKSMTKYYGAAGIRIGVLIASKEAIASLQAGSAPWQISAFDAAYLTAALQDDTFAERSLLANQKAKAYLADILCQTPEVISIYPSDANYLLAKLSTSAKALQQKLIPHRILLRDCSNFDGLNERYVRFGVKSIKTMQHLQKALHA
jgi:threonine-phosphate decarboxylase